MTDGETDTNFDQEERLDSSSTSIGYLSPERLEAIPPQHHAKHEFLIYLFVLLQDLVVETEQSGPRGFKFKPEDIPDFDAKAFSDDPIGYAALNCPQAKIPVLFDVSRALMADFYNFLHHALTAFERRQFTVGYANLRKPFRESLLLLCWICADEEEFFDKFLTDPVKAFNSGALSPEKRKQIFKKARESGSEFSGFPEELIENFVFSKTFSHGLGPSFDKATHLVTSKEHMRTEQMNLNFIFKSYLDDDVYETDYMSISLLTMFAYLVIYSVCNKFYPQHKNYKIWMLLAVWGTYEAVFLKTESRLFGSFQKTLQNTLKCMFCGRNLNLNVDNIPKFVMTERITCESCDRDQSFPLFWLFCHEHGESIESDA